MPCEERTYRTERLVNTAWVVVEEGFRTYGEAEWARAAIRNVGRYPDLGPQFYRIVEVTARVA